MLGTTSSMIRSNDSKGNLGVIVEVIVIRV